MPQRNKSSPLSHQQDQINRINSLGSSLAHLHHLKMMSRTQQWLQQAQETINTNIGQGESLSKWMWFKLRIFQWMHQHYLNASVSQNNNSLAALFFSLLVGVGYISLVAALYLLLITAIIWALPHLVDWFFHLE